MNPAERRAQGAHYTTEKNILKVIEPLFLDDLRTELARLKARRRGRRNTLLRFLDQLGELRLLDPACGCGNFLIPGRFEKPTKPSIGRSIGSTARRVSHPSASGSSTWSRSTRRCALPCTRKCSQNRYGRDDAAHPCERPNQIRTGEPFSTRAGGFLDGSKPPDLGPIPPPVVTVSLPAPITRRASGRRSQRAATTAPRLAGARARLGTDDRHARTAIVRRLASLRGARLRP